MSKSKTISSFRKDLKNAIINNDVAEFNEIFINNKVINENRDIDTDYIIDKDKNLTQNDLRKKYIGNIGKVVNNNGKIGLICDIGFSSNKESIPYYRVLLLVNNKDNIFETTWKSDKCKIISHNGLDYIHGKYFSDYVSGLER